jgi:tetratricopeptide (TPR) repeat protein
MTGRTWLTALLALGLAAPGGVCLAQGTDRRAEASAHEHYRKGMRLYDVGRFEEAIKEFEAAYQYQEGPVTIFNLAQAHRRAGNNAKALELYRTYLRKAPNAPDRGEVEERIAALERAMAEVQDRVAALEKASPPRPTEPAATVAVAPPPPAAPPPRHGRGMLVGGAVAAGAGVLLGGAGIVFAVRAHDKSVQSARAAAFDPALDDEAKSARRLEYLFLGVGGAAVAAAAVLVVLGMRPAEAGQGTVLVPSLDGQGARLALAGTF